MDVSDDAAVAAFKELLRIPSVSRDVHDQIELRKQMIGWLTSKLRGFGLETKTLELHQGWPVVIATYKGQDEKLPSILLNSHFDVTPVVRECWTVDPFGAEENEKGDIFGRGSQDMKSVLLMMMWSVFHLIKAGKRPLRTIHLSCMPDEEIGGLEGMAAFVESEEFKALNVGCALDEGTPSQGDTVTLYYGERTAWWLRVKATGPAGHGSRLIKNTAMEKLMRTVNHFLAFRAEQEIHLQEKGVNPGDVTTVNLTALKGGATTDGGRTFSINVIPTEAEAYFDVRFPPSISYAEMEAKLKWWTKEEGVSYEFLRNAVADKVTSLDPAENPFFRSLSDACTSMNLKFEPAICPVNTDGRFLRQMGIPVFGLTPILHTPFLLHDHDEFVNKAELLRAIARYHSIVEAVANTEIAPS